MRDPKQDETIKDRVAIIFDLFDRKIFSKREVVLEFLRNVSFYQDEPFSVVQAIIEDSHEWFKVDLLDTLEEWQKMDYFVRWASLEDSRTKEEIELDSTRLQKSLKEIGPRLIKILKK